MADTILQKDVRATRLVALDQKSAQALSDAVRMRILEVLNHKPMSAEELTKALENIGYKKAVTTVRHHLDALKRADLIEATRMVEVRGAVLKYYSPTVRAFGFDVPPEFDSNYSKLVLDASVKIQKILKVILGDKKFSNEFGKNSAICPICKGNHMQEYAAAEIVNHALVRAMEDYDKDNVSEKEPKGSAKKSQ